jgi:hypothetical protein
MLLGPKLLFTDLVFVANWSGRRKMPCDRGYTRSADLFRIVSSRPAICVAQLHIDRSATIW